MTLHHIVCTEIEGMPLDINLHATIIGSVVILILNSKFNNNNKY